MEKEKERSEREKGISVAWFYVKRYTGLAQENRKVEIRVENISFFILPATR